MLPEVFARDSESPVTSSAQVSCWLRLDSAGDDRQGRRVLFSGDLGHYDQPIIRDPVAPPLCDYLLVESTYGDRLHDPKIQRAP